MLIRPFLAEAADRGDSKTQAMASTGLMRSGADIADSANTALGARAVVSTGGLFNGEPVEASLSFDAPSYRPARE